MTYISETAIFAGAWGIVSSSCAFIIIFPTLPNLSFKPLLRQNISHICHLHLERHLITLILIFLSPRWWWTAALVEIFIAQIGGIAPLAHWRGGIFDAFAGRRGWTAATSAAVIIIVCVVILIWILVSVWIAAAATLLRRSIRDVTVTPLCFDPPPMLLLVLSTSIILKYCPLVRHINVDIARV